MNHTSIDERDDRAINAVFGSVSGDHVVIEQTWTQGETNRPAFKKMLRYLRPGDTLYISSIDRLGLDEEDTVRLWHLLTKEKGVEIVVLNEPELNSRENRELTSEKLAASVKAAFLELAAGLRIVN